MTWLLRALLAVLLAAVVGAALFPLSLALELADAPVTGEVSGRLWDGRIEDAQAKGRPLGLVEVRGAFLPLLRGRGEAAVAVAGPSGSGTGIVRAGDGVLTLAEMDASLPTAAYGLAGPLGRPLSGQATVRGTLTVGPEGCRLADLDVSTDALSDTSRRLGGGILVLSGPAACEDGALAARLSGRNALGGTRLHLRLRPGTYTSELTVDAADSRVGQALRAGGFRRRQDGYTLTTRGTY